MESRFEVPSWQARLHKQPYMFRVYALGCGAVVLAVSALVGWLAWRGFYTVEQYVADVAQLPTTLAPLTLSDPTPPTPSVNTGAGVLVRGQVLNHSGRTVQLSVPQGLLSPQVGQLARTTFASYATALRGLGADSPSVVLPSMDVMAAKADALESSVSVGLERACWVGWPSVGIRPLNEWLKALAVAAVRAVPPKTQAHEGMAETLAYLGHALTIWGESLPAADSGLIRQFQQVFESATLLAEPRGPWAESEDLKRLWRTSRALMLPLSPEAAAVLHTALRGPEAGWVAEQYQRWLKLLEALHGPAPALTLGASLANGQPPAQAVSLLPMRLWRPPDLLATMARRVLNDERASATTLALSGLVDELAQTVLLGEFEREPRHGWADWWIWARVPMVPVRLPTDPQAATAAPFATGLEKVLRHARYKLLRLTGRGCVVSHSVQTEFSLFGPPTTPLVPLVTGERPLVAEPALEVAVRFAAAASALDGLLAPIVGEAGLNEVRVVDRGVVSDDTVARRIREGATFFRALYVVMCADLGVSDRLTLDQRPTQAQIDAAYLWLESTAASDAELAMDVRECHVIGVAPSGETAWLGIRGVILEPIEVTTWNGPDMNPPRVLLLPMLDRMVFFSKRDAPRRELWRVATQWLGGSVLNRLME